MSAWSALRLLPLALAALALGCGQADANRAAMRVVAKVNGTEIAADQTPSAQALDRIIDRELLVQQALEAGLDRDPQVRISIDQARRRLLAQAWLERRAAGARSTGEEVRAFYRDNPALFAERRIYELRSLEVAADAALVEALREEAAAAADLDTLAAWLRSREAAFTPATVTQPAEALPLGRLSRLAGMQPGEIAVFDSAGGASVVALVHAEPAPLSEPQAAPLIEGFLAGRKRLELAAAEVKRLRAVASIEYVEETKAR